MACQVIADKNKAMSATGVDSNRPSEELGKLGALLSDLEARVEKGEQYSSDLSVDDLKSLLSLIQTSISDLEQQISSHKEEQSALLVESQELKKEIRELSSKLTEEVAQLTKVTKRL